MKNQRKANKRLNVRIVDFRKTYADLMRNGKVAAAKGMRQPGSLNKRKSFSIKGAK